MLSYARIAHREKGGVKLPLTPTLDNQVWAGTGVLEKAEYIEALDYSEVCQLERSKHRRLSNAAI
jgi:hypothetical protein